MAKFKVQHWLPAGYMKFFSITEVLQGRKSKIYYSNAVESKTKKVEKLSYKNYHYSHIDAEGAETSFHKMENNYPLIAEKIIKGNGLLKKEYYGLILTMIDFHSRNPSYENLTVEENYKAFEIVSQGMMKEIFGSLSKKSENEEEDMKTMLSFLKKNWELRRISAGKDKFISSDHPSLFFSIKDILAFIFLPINPCYGVVAVDKRQIQITNNTANIDDNGKLNGLQAARCIEFVYSDYDLSDYIGESKPLTNWFSKEKFKGFVKSDSWKPEFIDYPVTIPDGFSFLRIL